MYCRIIIYLFLGFLLIPNANCQKDNYYTDSLSYQQFLQKDWKELIKVGRKSNRRDVRFYYLQYRMAIAYYEKKNYMKSIRYFEEVIDSNNFEAPAYSYLYYAYLFSGQEEKAEKLKSAIPSGMYVTFEKDKAPLVKDISVLSIYSDFATDDFREKDLTEWRNIYGEIGPVLLQDSGIVVSTTQRLSPGIRLTESFSYIGMKYFQAYTFEGENKSFLQNYDQYQTYLQASIQFKNNWKFFLGGHYLNYHFRSLNYWSVTDTFLVTQELPSYDTSIFGQPYQVDMEVTFPQVENEIRIDSLSKRYDDFVFYTGIKNSSGYFQNKIGVAYSRLWGIDYLSLHTEHIYYPFGNTNLFLSLQLIGKYDFSSPIVYIKDLQNQQYLVGGNIGAKAFNNLYVTLCFKYADISNYVDYDGAAVYNHSYKLKKSFGLNLNWMFLNERLIVNTSFDYNVYRHFYSYLEIDESKEIVKTKTIYSETFDNSGNLIDQQTTVSNYLMNYNTYKIIQGNYIFNNYNFKLGISWYF